MPEEKVKQYECLCPCEHETGCIACENGNHDYHIVPPVPQEAAPATGTVATFMDMDMRLDTTMPVGQVDVQDSKGRRTIIPAPDEAMRVAADKRAESMDNTICKEDGVLPSDARKFFLSQALLDFVRQAGSERERRLMSVLFVIMSDMPKKRDWLDPDIEREASRLLGGELK